MAAFGLMTNIASADYRTKSGLNVVAAQGITEMVAESFFVTLDTDGEESRIASAGPFELFARCSVGSTDKIEILVRSTVGGWFEPMITRPIKADEERVVFSDSANGDQSTYENNVDRFSAVGPDENGRLFYIAIDGETVGLGLNIFDHECLAVGTVTLAELGGSTGGNTGGASDDDDEDDDHGWRKYRKRRWFSDD